MTSKTKKIVEEFIAKLKNLQQIISERGKKYERTHCIPCLSTKKKEDLLYGTKHVSTVTFFVSTSLSSVTNCVEGLGARDAGKIVAMISGIFSMVLEGICSWTTSRDLNNKLAKASIIRADISDLDGFEQFNYFVSCFLNYAEEVGALKQLIDHNNDTESEGSLNQELRERKRVIKRTLEQCEDSLQAIDNNFLEHLMKENGITIKEKWQSSLRTVFKKLSETLSPRLHPKADFIAKSPFFKTMPNTLTALEEKDEQLEVEGKQEIFIKMDGIDKTFFSGTDSDEDYLSEEDILYDNECTQNIAEDEQTAPRPRRFCVIQ